MTVHADSVWLITGASSGFGAEFADQALGAGHRVVATARRPENLAALAERYPDTALVLGLDVTDKEQSESVVRTAMDRFGSIDVLVNNAGYGYLGAQEEGDEDSIRALFDVNVFGLARLTRLVLPGMRSRRRGHIVNLSSIAGLSAYPGIGYYAASKFAVEALSESLAAEVAPFGIRVLIVEPGMFRTDFCGRSMGIAPSHPAYVGTPAASNRERIISSDGKQEGDPAAAVSAVIAMLDHDEPPLRLVLGEAALDRALARFEAVRVNFETWRKVSSSPNLLVAAEG